MLLIVLIGNLNKVFAAIILSYCLMAPRVTCNKDAWTNSHIAPKVWNKRNLSSSHVPRKIVQITFSTQMMISMQHTLSKKLSKEVQYIELQKWLIKIMLFIARLSLMPLKKSMENKHWLSRRWIVELLLICTRCLLGTRQLILIHLVFQMKQRWKSNLLLKMILIKVLRHQVTGHSCFNILLDLIMQIWKPRATWNGTHKMMMKKSRDSGHQPILTSNHSSTAQQMEMANQNQQPIWQNVQ